MDRWKNQLNNIGANAFEFAQRITSELTEETESDPSTELQYHKDQAIKFERDLIKCQSELSEKENEIKTLSDSLQEAFEQEELTRQTFLNKLAAKELQLEKAQHQIEQLRDFQHESTMDGDTSQLSLELDLVRAEKANLSEELTALNTKLQYYQAQLAAKSKEPVPESVDVRPHDLELLQEELTKSNNRVESLRQEMSNLLEKNHSLLSECTERQEVCQKLEHQLTAIQTLNTSAHSNEVEKLKHKIKELENIIEKQNTKDSELNESFNELNQYNDQFQQQLTALKEQNDRLKSSELEAKQQLENEAKLNEKKLHEFEHKIASLEKEIQEFTNIVEQKQAIIDNFEKDADKEKETFDQLSQSKEHFEKELEILHKQNEKLIESHSNETNALKVEIQQLKNVIEEKQALIRNVEEIEESNEQSLHELNQLNNQLRQKLNALHDKNESLESTVNELKNEHSLEIEHLNSQIDELNNALERSKNEAMNNDKQSFNELDQYDDQFQQQLTDLKEQNDRLKNSELEAKQKLQLNEKTVQEFEHKIASLEKQIQEFTSIVEEKQAIIDDFEKDANKEKETFDQLSQSKEEFEKELEVLHKQNEELIESHSNETNNLKTEIEKLKNVIEEKQALIQNVGEIEESNEQSLHELNQLRQELNSLHDKNESLESIISELKNKHSLEVAQLHEKIQNLENSNSEIEELRSKISKLELDVETKETLIQQSEEMVNNSIQSFDELNQKIQILQDENKQLLEGSNETSKLNEIINELKAELASKHALVQQSEEIARISKQSFEELQRSNIQLREEIKSLQVSNEQLKIALTESETSLDELMTERKNLMEGTNEAEIYRVHAQDRMDRKQQEIEEAYAKVLQKDNEIEFLRVSLEQQKLENEKLTKRINGINSTIKDLQSTYAESQNQLHIAEQMLSKSDSELRHTIQELQTEKNAIEREHAEQNEKLRSAESQILDLRAEIELLEERCQNDSISHHSNAPTNPSTSSNIATFVIPPELRQFIVSAITCEEHQRADGAMLLASLIGATPEEKHKVEESYTKPTGWTSIFRSPQPAASNRPQNTREFLTQFVDFLERESSSGSAANIERTDPVRLDHDFKPQHQNHVDKDLNNIINQQ